MSISLVVLRLETADKYPTLKHIEYQAPSKYYTGSKGTDREASPSEWPVLVSDRLLSIHRGQREPSSITVITLDKENIEQEMAGYKSDLSDVEEDKENGSQTEMKSNTKSKEMPFLGTGGIPRTSSKESTPGPSSSKEGTPGVGEEGSGRRVRGPHKDTLHFISGNPTVDVTQGILHLFKENTKTSLDEEEMRSEMLCMLAVPTSMTIHDLLQFTAPCYPAIQHMRIIRDTSPNQYMVLIKFRTQEDADFFYTTFNGQTFNSIEPDICRLVYVARVETTSELEDGGLPIPGHSELPTCPVCLERMDESVDGILTILCNHSFHGECLAKWADTSCPICRFCQTPDEVPDQRCLSCGAAESLWICLICGHIGCGRYAGGHAHRHFMETNHLFSLQVGNNRVWDYVRDNYVHRLLQNEGDGKVVSYERVSPATETKEQLMEGEEKLSALQLEYTHLLSSQLESQREFFEAKIADAKREALREVEESKQLLEKQQEETTSLQNDLATLKREKQTVDKKIQNMTQRLSKALNELETEKHLNIHLREGKKDLVVKVEKLEKSLKDKEQEVKELESQITDVMAHLEAMSTIENNPELQGGAIALGDSKKGPVARRKRR